jgi:hypothetical protein
MNGVIIITKINIFFFFGVGGGGSLKQNLLAI